ncbi:MAG: TolC family protein [Helicobacter sp.]|nr:TolC family protein [Helicobacter sp.]
MNNKWLLLLALLGVMLAREDQILTLSRAYEKALQKESQFLAQRYRTEATAEGVNQALGALLPRITVDASAGHNKYNYTVPEISEPYKDYGITAYVPVFRPGLYLELDQAKDRAKGAEYELQRHANQLGLEVAKAYFNVMRTQKNLALARAMVDANEVKFRQTSGMLQAGLNTKMGMLEARVAFDRSRAELLAEEQRYNVAKMTLEYMIGEKITNDRILDISLEQINPDALIIASYDWQKGLANNPDVQIAQKQLELAQRELTIRRWQHFPTADFQISQKHTESRDPSLRENDLRALIVVSLPIFEGGRTQSAIREGLKMQNAAIEDLNHYKKQAILKLERTLSEQKLAIESVKVFKDSEYSAQLYLSTIEQGYERGLRSLFDVLEARSRLYQVRRDLIDAVYDLIVNQLNLLDVTGTLNTDRIYEIERKINLLGRTIR